MTDQNTVSLIVGGVAYEGWKSVKIDAGIEQQARAFELSITQRFPNAPEIIRAIAPGSRVQLLIGDDLVCTGWVDAVPVQYDGRHISAVVRGRSLTADLVDACPVQSANASTGGAAKSTAGSGGYWAQLAGLGGASAGGKVSAPSSNTGQQWRGQKLEVIAAALASPYGVQVLNETDTGAVIPNHQIQPGETVFESIDRLMRLRHVLSTDDAAGNLVFVEPGSAGRAVDKLVLGQNVLTGAAERDHTGLFSDYVCKGQRAGSDSEFGAAVAQNDGAAQDSTVTRKRVLVLQQSGQADTGTCQDRVEYEKAHRKAKALEAKYSINGWRQSNGVLWRHNMLVHVTDSIIGFDRDLLVSKISYVLDEKGQRLELSVAPPDGFKTKAGKVKAEARKKGGGSSWSELAE